MSLVSLDGAVAGMRQQSAVIQRLIDRYRFNKERDRMVNAGAKPGGQADPKMAKKMQGERRRRHSLHRSDGIKLRD